jgi:hypothetical protein
VEGPLTFLASGSRGSSWQRWPMLRLMHLVHGRSCREGGQRQIRSPADGRLEAIMSLAGVKGKGGTYQVTGHVLFGEKSIYPLAMFQLTRVEGSSLGARGAKIGPTDRRQYTQAGQRRGQVSKACPEREEVEEESEP